MMIKKSGPLLFFCFALSSSLQAFDDDTFMDELNNPSHIEANMEIERDCCTPCNVPDGDDNALLAFRNALVEFGVPQTLQKNLFKGTNPVQSRSLLDLPSTGLDLTIHDGNCGQLSLNFFYNQTTAMRYRCNSPCIGSYLNITDANLLDAVDETLLPDNIAIDDILDLFLRANPFRLQERRAGMMINFNRRWSRGTFGFNLPFYYLEHNFFLTEAEQATISEAPIFEEFGPLSSDENDALAFGYKNLFSDQIGFGDLRLNGYYAFKDTEKHYATIGGVLTLPTAFAIAKHVFGGKYCKTLQRQPLNLLVAGGLAFGGDEPQLYELQAMGACYGTRFLHQLTANLAYTSMGNNHHVTFGPRFEYKYTVNPCWAFKLYSDIQYFCPAHEQRFFIPKNRPDDQDYTNDDPTVVKENLLFLSKQLEDVLFPYCINTLVSPGFLINLSASTLLKTKRTDIEFGYNFWRQSTEHLKLPACGKGLDICKGIKAGAYQNMFYARFMLKMPEHCGGLHFGVYGDVAFQSHNIGNAFTLAANIEFYY